jgi:hypothetical protein
MMASHGVVQAMTLPQKIDFQSGLPKNNIIGAMYVAFWREAASYRRMTFDSES